MKGRGVGVGALVALVAAGVAFADILLMPSLVEARILPALGERAGDAAVVETLYVALVFGVLILAAALAGLIERRNVFARGRRPATMAAIGLAVGVAGVSTAVGYAGIAGALMPGAASAPGLAVLALGLGTVAIQTAGEEIFFRGWLQPSLVSRWGVAAGVGATALIFAGLHVPGGAREPLSILNLVLGGLMFGLFALHGRGLAGAAMLHFGWNATEQLIWGVDPNPGVGGFGALADRDLVGVALWGGSGEGLNASLGMTFALIAILVPLALTLRGSRNAVAPRLSRSPS